LTRTGRNRAVANARENLIVENLIVAERPILAQPKEDGAGRGVGLTYVSTNDLLINWAK